MDERGNSRFSEAGGDLAEADRIEAMKTVRERSDTTKVVFLVAVISLPMSYPLSVGPAWWLCQHRYISMRVFSAYTMPLRFVLRRSQPLNGLMNRYLSYWESP